jgi:hypothetical protein
LAHCRNRTGMRLSRFSALLSPASDLTTWTPAQTTRCRSELSVSEVCRDETEPDAFREGCRELVAEMTWNAASLDFYRLSSRGKSDIYPEKTDSRHQRAPSATLPLGRRDQD